MFVLSFENNAARTSCKRYYLPQVKIKNYNVMIDGQNFFKQPIKNNLGTSCKRYYLPQVKIKDYNVMIDR